MSETMAMQDLVGELRSKGSISADDVLALRRNVWADGIIRPEEAVEVFGLDQACRDKDTSWTDFYVEALTKYFVYQAKPRGYVSEEQAEQLIGQLTKDGHIDQESELALLINIIDRATVCPEQLVMVVLDAVRESILTPQTAAYGSNRPPATVTAADAAIVRRVIHAPGGDNSIAVTQREAEFMFDLNDALAPENTDPEWDDVFVKAISCHLMSPLSEPMKMTAEDELKRQEWLEEGPAPIGTTFRAMGKALGRADIPFAEAWRELDPFGHELARKHKENEERHMKQAFARETISPNEAKWLVARLDKDGKLKDNEIALLKFIKKNSPKIDPQLDPLFASAGV